MTYFSFKRAVTNYFLEHFGIAKKDKKTFKHALRFYVVQRHGFFSLRRHLIVMAVVPYKTKELFLEYDSDKKRFTLQLWGSYFTEFRSLNTGKTIEECCDYIWNNK